MGFLTKLSRWAARSPSTSRFFSTRNHRGMLTHVPASERPSINDIQHKLDAIKTKLQSNRSLDAEDKQQLWHEATQLSEFELGRFLIANEGGLSGWWTYYCILGYRQQHVLHPLEKFLLTEAPTILATRERFTHFQQAAQRILSQHCNVSAPITLASIPGGMAADLLSLDVSAKQCQLTFVNIDLDASVFKLARALAKERNSVIPLECRQQDAQTLTEEEEFNLVMSNGLNIYMPKRQDVIALYTHFLRSLKPGGHLITSALTPPPSVSERCEWKMSAIDTTALKRQAGIFAHVLNATWANFCSTTEMTARLQAAGFDSIKVIPDERNMFPTFVAKRPTA